MQFVSTSGAGPAITAGTATTDVAAMSITRTNNNAAVVKGVEITYTDTTSAAGFLPLAIRGGASGTADLLTVSKVGTVTGGRFSSNTMNVANLNSQLDAFTVFTLNNTNGRARTDQTLLFGGTGTGISAVSAGVIGIGTGAEASTAGSLSLTNLTASGNVAVATQSPASGAAGTAGTITWDTGFIYICTATGVWKRVAITGGY